MCCSVCVVLLCGSWQAVLADNSPSFQQEMFSDDLPENDGSPESVVRLFLISMATKDEAGIRLTSMPLSKGEFEWLLKGEPIPAAEIPRWRAHLRTLPMKRMQIGDIVEIPGGGTLKLDERHINKYRQQVHCEGLPLPLILTATNRGWRVEAAMVVAARKAAFADHAAREAAEGTTASTQNTDERSPKSVR
jgi:hypothetical protein